MTLTHGELFAGYGGLGMGIERAFGERVRLDFWSDVSPGSVKVMGHRFPGVPNLGDVTTVDWSAVPTPDILSGGSPCTDLSQAGARKGMTAGTRSNLWVAMREAVAVLRPPIVVWENVRGAMFSEADSDLEPCPGCVGEPEHRGPVLRALGRVLGDLSSLGYDCGWYSLHAADVGAPHGRYRVFVIATDPHDRSGAARRATRGGAPGGRAFREPVGCDLLPTPTSRDHKGRNQRDDDSCLAGALLGAAGRLLPTPTHADAHHSGGGYNGQNNETLTDAVARREAEFGRYASAIARWEAVFRDAPAAAEDGPRGGRRVRAAFSEWMMGLPAGWVTDVPGITYPEAMELLGNGVVPQQAAAGLGVVLEMFARREKAA